MDELYSPNSNRFKETRKLANEKGTSERAKVEKVVQGQVKTKKKSEIKKITDVFISEDVSNVKKFIFMDVIVPAVKKAISDIVTTGVEMLLYGESGRSRRNGPSGQVPYQKYYSSGKRDEPYRYSSSRTITGYNYDDIILETRGEAEDVLERMGELIETYSQVTVADMYDLVGVTGDYTDNRYGWTNIRNADIIRVRDGYLLKLPKVLPLN